MLAASSRLSAYGSAEPSAKAASIASSVSMSAGEHRRQSSGTSSSVRFGNVQLQAANAIGADAYWMVALNSLGVAAGKMLAPQSIALGLVSVNESGKVGELLKKVLPYTVLYLVIMALIAYFGLPLFESLHLFS